MKNRIEALLGIKYPIIQAGMIWCSPWQLAASVSNAGGLGIIGAGSMYPHVLEEHIVKCKAATDKPFGVNIPLLYPDLDAIIDVVIKHKVQVVITSAGNPKTYTSTLKERGIVVMHVVSSAFFALKAQAAGVDAVIAEGFEAGGHNGREETTTLCLLPGVVKILDVPVIAAGGIASGAAMLACMVLGAEGVQIGSRFVLSEESSAHINFKNSVVQAGEGDTKLTLKEITPVRLLKNKFFEEIEQGYKNNLTLEELKALLGRARAKKGMFEGDLDQGELEIGQVSALMDQILPAQKIVEEIIEEYNEALRIQKNANFL